MANNPFGLDTPYFKKQLEHLLRNVDHFTPVEMTIAFRRLSNAANPNKEVLFVTSEASGGLLKVRSSFDLAAKLNHDYIDSFDERGDLVKSYKLVEADEYTTEF